MSGKVSRRGECKCSEEEEGQIIKSKKTASTSFTPMGAEWTSGGQRQAWRMNGSSRCVAEVSGASGRSSVAAGDGVWLVSDRVGRDAMSTRESANADWRQCADGRCGDTDCLIGCRTARETQARDTDRPDRSENNVRRTSASSCKVLASRSVCDCPTADTTVALPTNLHGALLRHSSLDILT